MTRDPQVITRNNRGLRRRSPKVPDSLHREPQEFLWMLANEFRQFPLLLIHEFVLAQLLKTTHGYRIIAGMFTASPQARGRTVVGLVQLERQIITDENESVESFIVPDRPRHSAENQNQKANHRSGKTAWPTGGRSGRF